QALRPKVPRSSVATWTLSRTLAPASAVRIKLSCQGAMTKCISDTSGCSMRHRARLRAWRCKPDIFGAKETAAMMIFMASIPREICGKAAFASTGEWNESGGAAPGGPPWQALCGDRLDGLLTNDGARE